MRSSPRCGATRAEMDGALQPALSAFLGYLQVERRLSPHTLDAYRRDLGNLARWLHAQGIDDWRAMGQEMLRTYVAGTAAAPRRR